MINKYPDHSVKEPSNDDHSVKEPSNDDQFVFQEGNYTWVLTSRCNGGPTHVTVASGANWHLPEVFSAAMARYPHDSRYRYYFATLSIPRIRALYNSMAIDYADHENNGVSTYTFTVEDGVADHWVITVQEFGKYEIIQSKRHPS